MSEHENIVSCRDEGDAWRVRLNGFTVWTFTGWGREAQARRLAMNLMNGLGYWPGANVTLRPTPTPEPEHE